MCLVSLSPARSWWPTIAEPSPPFVQFPQGLYSTAGGDTTCASTMFGRQSLAVSIGSFAHDDD
jgi:hypothetical protein